MTKIHRQAHPNDFQDNELLNVVLQKLIAPPIVTIQGKVYYDSVKKIPFFSNGVEWVPFFGKAIQYRYPDQASLIADQSIQVTGFIYYQADTDTYYEYLGTTNGNISDYNPIFDSSIYQNVIEKGQPNGYVPLDAGAKIQEIYLPDSITGQVEYIGTWNAGTNSPTLANPPASTTKGHYYIVTTAGTQFGIDFNVGDWIISNGSSWAKVDNTDAVTSVFGRLGNILAVEADYQAFYPRLSQTYANPTWISSLAWAKITGTPTTLSGYGITDAVPNTRTITAGAGLTGGGALSANITISHADTSTQASVDNANGTVIQDVTLDTYGHVTALGSVNLDSRYVQLNLGNQASMEINRDVLENGIYSYNAVVSTTNKPSGLTYGSALNFGRGIAGSAQILIGWTAGDQNWIGYRSLRDTTDNWWDWKRIYHDNYHPNADVWTTARTITIGSTGKSVDGSANVSWSLAEIGAAAISHTHTWSQIFGEYRSIVADTDILPDSGLYRRSNTAQGFIWHGRLNSGGEAVQLNLGRENQGTLRWRDVASDSSSYSAWKIAVDTSRTISAGTGLTGGGNLGADRTLSFDTSFGDNRYVTLNTAQTITGSKIFNTSSVDIINALRFVISTADSAHQRADARDNATNFARLHWYGVTDAGATSNFRHAWYDGAAYVDVTANSGGRIDFTGSATSIYIGSNRVFDDGYHPNADVWTTARTLTIGSTGKSVNGSANVSWSLAEIGAQAAGNYVTLDTTQTITGLKTFTSGLIGSDIARIIAPGGAVFRNTTQSITGAIRITLPASTFNNSCMMAMKVVVYNYSSNTSRIFHIGGYTFVGGPNWVNTFATQESDVEVGDMNVRFGRDTTNWYIYIGETNSGWSYPQVMVTEFLGGFSGASSAYATGWDIDFVTSFATVSSTIPARTDVKISGDQTITGNKTFSAALSLNTQATAVSHAVRADRVLTAGNGLTGGGNLTTNLTFTLGTPSTLTASTTNAVTATSHTHAITTTTTGAANTIVQTDGSGNITATGYVNTSRLGVVGVYSSSQVQGIWSIGPAYTISIANNNFGTQYGITYAYSTTGGAPISNTHQILFVNAGTWGVAIGLTGEIRAKGDVVAFASSDKRLKDNLSLIENPLDNILKLNGYSFDWNSKQTTYTGHDYGVVAQEVEALFPEMVQTRDNGYKAVKYEKLIPVMIEAIKELKNKIDKLENK